jgi:hypothetical protein
LRFTWARVQRSWRPIRPPPASRDHLRAAHDLAAAIFTLQAVNGFVVRSSPGWPDTRRDAPVANEKL